MDKEVQNFRSRSRGRRTASLAALLSFVLLLTSCSNISDFISGNKRENTDKTEAPRSTRVLIEQVQIAPDKAERGPGHNSVAEAAARRDEKDGMSPLSTMEIAQIAQPAVVAISTTGLKETRFGKLTFENAGSGVIVSEDGYIVTNNHVIADASQIDVVLANGKNYRAELIGADKNNDIAVIRIQADKLPAAKIGNSDDLMVGELAVAVGNPLGDFQGTVTAGIISSLGRTLVLEDGAGSLIELRNLLQTDAAINSGNSGGGLFNSYGELIGINVAKAGSRASNQTFVEGLGFAIPTNTATPIINALVNDGYVHDQPSLNIRGSTVTEQMAESYPGQLVVGVLVREIGPASAVAEAGLKVGDVITKFAGEKVYSVAQLNLVKFRFKAGDKVEMEIFRNGETINMSFVLDEASH